jgi:VPDSG-CTERM motif
MSNKSLPIDHSTRNQLLRYSLGAAAVAAAASPSGSSANVISFDPADVSGNSIFFNLDNNMVSTSTFPGAEFALTDTGIIAAKPTQQGYNGNQVVTQSRGSIPFIYNYALKLNAGDTIGGSRTFTNSGRLNYSGMGPGIGDWNPGDKGFVGLSLAMSGANTGPFYGWAEISLNNFDGSGAGEFTLFRYAYDDVAGEAIAAGDIGNGNGGGGSGVPDSGSTALLLILGAGGLAALRSARRERSLA